MESESDASSSTMRTWAVRSVGIRWLDRLDWVGSISELPELSGEQEPDLLGDVDGVVSDPFELAGADVHPQPPVETIGIRAQRCDLFVHAHVQSVDGIVHLRQPQTELEVPPRERLQGDPDHRANDVAHLLEMGHDGGAPGEVPDGHR